MVTGLEVELSFSDHAVIVAAAGEVDIASSPLLENALEGALSNQSAAPVCCSLSEVSFLDSCGIGTLVAAHNLASTLAREFCVVGAHGRVERAMQLTMVTDLLSYHDSIEAFEAGRAGSAAQSAG